MSSPGGVSVVKVEALSTLAVGEGGDTVKGVVFVVVVVVVIVVKNSVGSTTDNGDDDDNDTERQLGEKVGTTPPGRNNGANCFCCC